MLLALIHARLLAATAALRVDLQGLAVALLGFVFLALKLEDGAQHGVGGHRLRRAGDEALEFLAGQVQPALLVVHLAEHGVGLQALRIDLHRLLQRALGLERVAHGVVGLRGHQQHVGIVGHGRQLLLDQGLGRAELLALHFGGEQARQRLVRLADRHSGPAAYARLAPSESRLTVASMPAAVCTVAEPGRLLQQHVQLRASPAAGRRRRSGRAAAAVALRGCSAALRRS